MYRSYYEHHTAWTFIFALQCFIIFQPSVGCLARAQWRSIIWFVPNKIPMTSWRFKYLTQPCGYGITSAPSSGSSHRPACPSARLGQGNDCTLLCSFPPRMNEAACLTPQIIRQRCRVYVLPAPTDGRKPFTRFDDANFQI